MIFRKYISFLLGIFFIVYLVHSVVPHYHHESVGQQPLEATCKHDHSMAHENEELPEKDSNDHHQPISHCHAFNNLAFEKITSRKIVPADVQMIAINSDTELLLSEVSNHHVVIQPLFVIPLRGPVFLSSCALRGPPVLT